MTLEAKSIVCVECAVCGSSFAHVKLVCTLAGDNTKRSCADTHGDTHQD